MVNTLRNTDHPRDIHSVSDISGSRAFPTLGLRTLALAGIARGPWPVVVRP